MTKLNKIDEIMTYLSTKTKLRLIWPNLTKIGTKKIF